MDSTKKLLYLTSEFGKTAGYKVNTQKSKAFLYTNNETSETKLRKNIPFDIATRKTKGIQIGNEEAKLSLFADDIESLHRK